MLSQGETGELEQAPLVVASGEMELLTDHVERARAAGWRIVHDWQLPERTWQVTRMRVVCVGELRAPGDDGRAVMAAARGAGVMVAVPDAGALLDRVVEDLSRIGTVEISRGLAEDPLEPDQRRVLELLGSGATLDETAAELDYSRRTVNRRLAAAKRALGVSTTAEALVRIRRDASGHS